jgi:formylglycine-generating enzyme required for sulfatase activity
MVDVGPFCIDATEVTQQEYAAFVADKGGDVGDQPPACSWNHDFAPRPDVANGPSLPAVGIDWCDAVAYCAWAGKRLCGKIGGGSVPDTTAARDDPAVDEWFYACSEGGQRAYPYGASYDAEACVGEGAPGAEPAGTRARCQGGFGGIFDMSGNVWEWEDSCDESGNCANRGGALQHSGTALSCAFAATVYTRPRTESPGDTGFRCCD